jgi:hypothetical protein
MWKEIFPSQLFRFFGSRHLTLKDKARSQVSQHVKIKPVFTDSVKLSIKSVREVSTAELELELPEQLSCTGENFLASPSTRTIPTFRMGMTY